MECKKALTASGGDMERAIEELRKSGMTKADKKAGRVAAEGAIAIIASSDGKQAVMVEVNSETDFVARDANFTAFVKAVAETALQTKIQDVDAAFSLTICRSCSAYGGRSTFGTRLQKWVKMFKFAVLCSAMQLQHGWDLYSWQSYWCDGGAQMYDNKELARDIAMHIAASKPIVISPEHVSQEIVAKEKEIYMAQAATSGKPQEIIEKMVAGRLKKYLDEVSLIGQPFVKDPDVTVGSLLNKHRAKVLAFYRYEVGEGIEKTD